MMGYLSPGLVGSDQLNVLWITW